MKARALPAAATLLLVAGGAAAQDGGGATVTLGDGSNVALVSWSLSYEYLLWKQGTPQHQTPPARKDGTELLLAKKSYPVKGQTLEIQYTPAVKQREQDGTVRNVKVAVATGLSLVGPDGKKTPFKLEAPQRELVVPVAEKGALFVVRTLDLRGQTLTGTKRELCLVSFNSMVECPDDPAQQVARIQVQ